MDFISPILPEIGNTFPDFLLTTEKSLSAKNVKRLSLEDVPRMISLKNKLAKDLFGDVDIYDVVYNSFVSLGIEEDGKLVGAACFNDYPCLKAVSKFTWEQWLNNLFSLNFMKSINTYWIQLLLFDDRYITTFLEPILEVIFAEHSTLKYVAIVIPPKIRFTPFLTEFGTRILPDDCGSVFSSTTLGLLARKDFSKEYIIRKGEEEDNDDIINLIDTCSKELKEQYGEYYIAEIMTRLENNCREIIVALHEKRIVGILISNDEVNYDILNESFEVGVFHGFKTPQEMDECFPSAYLESHHSFAHEESVVGMLSFEDIFVLSSPEISSANTSEIFTLDRIPSRSESSEESWTIDPSLNLSNFLIHRTEDIANLSTYYKGDSQTSVLSTCLLNINSSNYLIHSSQIEVERRISSVHLRNRESSLLVEEIYQKLPAFYGDPDAFALEILAFMPDHEQTVHLLEQAAFECHENKNFLLMSVPPIFQPIKYLRDFIRVTPRNENNLPQELFLLHRNAVDPVFEVRYTIEQDAPYVMDFLDQMTKPSYIYKQILESVEDKDSGYISFIMTCNSQIIGIAVLNEDVDIDYLYAHYALHNWIDETKHGSGDAAILENLLIYPIFQRFCNYFLRQIHRLTEFSLLIHSITHKDIELGFKDRPLLNAIRYLIPVAPRNLPEYDAKLIEESQFPPEYITQTRDLYTIFISTIRLLGIKKTEVGARIVVVGAGDTAISFLETLICGSNPDMLVTYNNITVVSPHGLPFYREGNVPTSNLLTSNRGYTFYHRSLQLNIIIHVNIVHGVLTQIKREQKIIVVNDEVHLPYEYLILFCGEQYRMPRFKSKSRRQFSDFPENAFIINTDLDVIHVFSKLQKYKKHFADKRFMKEDFFIVYGNDIRALACLQSLLAHGVPPESLILIEPCNIQIISSSEPFERPHFTFPDPEIVKAIDKALEKLGVKFYKGFLLNDWEVNIDNKVVSIEITSGFTTEQLGCKFMFIYAEKSISLRTYEAIFDSGLVFDGRLVIDSRFRSSDPYIYAAGPLTIYSRKYHACHRNHIYYNAHEVGETIGRQFRKMLLPDSSKNYEEGLNLIFEESEDLLPIFKKPIIIYCLLPGGAFYLSVSAPGRKNVELEKICLGEDQRLLITGDYENIETQGYFKIIMNEYDAVESICCLSKEPLDITNLINIWGKQATLLNDLLVRFDMAKIPDLFDFFKEPFFSGIFHDKFPPLLSDIRSIFLETKVLANKSIIDVIYDYFKKNDWNMLSDRENHEINNILRESSVIGKIEEKITEYIQKNKLFLPMYAHTSFVNMIIQNLKKSPMFNKIK